MALVGVSVVSSAATHTASYDTALCQPALGEKIDGNGTYPIGGIFEPVPSAAVPAPSSSSRALSADPLRGVEIVGRSCGLSNSLRNSSCSGMAGLVVKGGDRAVGQLDCLGTSGAMETVSLGWTTRQTSDVLSRPGSAGISIKGQMATAE
ncbi:hypothetical protein KC325_g37 [Hortaea werneckii]|nr:hypothetical protein KC325_g37 [Hortaea werneckii]